MGGEKNLSLSIIYFVTALISLALLLGCIFSVRTKRFWFITLFSSVLTVNTGYALLSVSADLQGALWANRLSYLGSVFLPLSMLMILLEVTATPYKKILPKLLIGLSAAVFLVAASPGLLPIYYKEVSFAVINGVSTLVKVYGPWHSLYPVYLLGYFTAMVALIFHAKRKKTIDSAAHAVILAIAVLVNIGVWFIEQLVSLDFEMLSVSYLISEMFLLGVHLVTGENQRLRAIIRQVETVQQYAEPKSPAVPEPLLSDKAVSPEAVEGFLIGLSHLTPTERSVYDAYVARLTTKEILADMNIKESTLKYHNRNLYGKLGVANRKELLEMHKHVKAVKAKLSDNSPEA